MIDPHPEAAVGQSPAELEETSRVPARHHAGARARDPVELPLEELPGYLGLHQVVDAGRPAAEVGLGEIDQPEPRDRAQDCARRLPHALAVREVTGLVVGHGQVERPPRLRQVLRQELADVPHPRADGGRPRVIPEEMPVVAESRSAASGVRDDPVGVREGRGVPPGQLPRGAPIAPVEMKRAAAPLLLGHDHAVPGARQEAHRRAVDLGEELRLDASLQHRDGPARAPAGRKRLGREALRPGGRKRREEALHRPDPREALQDAGSSHDTLEPAPLIEPRQGEQPREPLALGKDAQEELAQDAPAERARHLPLDLPARLLDEAPERARRRGTRSRTRGSRGTGPCGGRSSRSGRCGPRTPRASGTRGRAGSPSPGRAPGMSGTGAGRCRSARSRGCPPSPEARCRRRHRPAAGRRAPRRDRRRDRSCAVAT